MAVLQQQAQNTSRWWVGVDQGGGGVSANSHIELGFAGIEIQGPVAQGGAEYDMDPFLDQLE